MSQRLLVISLALIGLSAADVSYATESASPASTTQSTQATPTGDSWTESASAAPSAPKNPASAQPAPTTARAPAARPNDAAQRGDQRFSPIVSGKAQTTATAPARADGQWVYTQQYGWVWIPYAREYTYIAPEGYPYSYVYYPTAGWCWVYSPWVFGWGPGPYWGFYGPMHFAWYARPWFARPYYRGGYWGHPYSGHGYWGGGFRGGGFRGGGRHR